MRRVPLRSPRLSNGLAGRLRIGYADGYTPSASNRTADYVNRVRGSLEADWWNSGCGMSLGRTGWSRTMQSREIGRISGTIRKPLCQAAHYAHAPAGASWSAAQAVNNPTIAVISR